MNRNRRSRPVELGVALLVYNIMQMGLQSIPPVTLITIAGQVALYMGYINVPWERHEVCISALSVLRKRDWRRLVFSALEHGDDMHLYYNMTSFLMKGRTLENKYGSKNFALLLAIITLLTNAMYVAIGQTMTQVTHDSYFQSSCAIGFSGVIFALKVLTTYENPSERAQVWGITMPGKYAAWAELVVIHLLVPNSSSMGHLAGILVGVIYCKTFIGSIIDRIISTISGDRMVHGDRNYYNNDYYSDYYRYRNYR